MPLLVHETTIDHRLPLTGKWVGVLTMFVECPDCGWEREAEEGESEYDLWRLDCPICSKQQEQE
jgi:hypothetical protein